MKAIVKSLLALCFLFVAPSASGQDDSKLDKLKQSFESRRTASVEQHAKAMEKLRMSYRVALERLQDKAQQSGDLEDVLPVRDEIARIDKDEEPLPPIGATASADLKKLRETYDEAATRAAKAHAEEIVSMSDKMLELLEKESAALTKAGKIEEALAARTLAESIGSAEGLATSRDLVGEHSKNDANAAATPLLKAKWTIIEESGFYIGPGDGQVGDGAFTQGLRDLIATQPGEATSHFVATAPSRIEFVFSRPVKKLETELFMAAVGDVSCRLLVDDRVVARSAVSAAERVRRKWTASFPATKRLVLEVDNNGTSNGDWLVLLSPVVTYASR
jgi:hypothetical protein